MSTLMEMIDDLIHEADVAALPEWTGIPIGIPTFDYHHPAELDAGWRRWIDLHGNFNSVYLSKMWHRSHTVPHTVIGEHSIDQFDLDLRCKAGLHDEHRATLGLGRICQCVGGSLTQIICAGCSWHHLGSEDECVRAWHDHAFPGWCDLPILPDSLRGKMGGTKMSPKLEDWFEANYPVELRIPGAPILTARGPYGHRAVIGYSPFGGYDISVPEQEGN